MPWMPFEWHTYFAEMNGTRFFSISVHLNPTEPRSKLSAIDFSIRWNLFFQNLNGVTRAQAFHKLRASSCTRKLRASPKSRKHFKHKSKLIYNEKGYTTWWLLWRKPTFEQSVGFGLGLQELPREFRARFAQTSRKQRGSWPLCPPATGSKMIVDSPYLIYLLLCGRDNKQNHLVASNTSQSWLYWLYFGWRPYTHWRPSGTRLLAK